MARSEDVLTSIWSDKDFLSLSGPARGVFLWSFTNSRTGVAGIYRVAPQLIAVESGWEGEQLEAALAELQAKRFLFYDGDVMFVRTRVKRLRTKSDTIAKSIGRALEEIGAHPFVAMWWQENGGYEWITKVVDRVDTANPDDPCMTHPVAHPEPTSGFLGEWKGEGEKGGVGGKKRRQRTKPNPNEPPPDFPDDLRPHLAAAHPVIGGLAERHGADAVTVYSLGAMMMGRPKKPFVKAAFDCVAYYDGPKGRTLKDPLSAYRNWLEKESDLAAIEQLDEQGRPASRLSLVANGHSDRVETTEEFLARRGWS